MVVRGAASTAVPLVRRIDPPVAAGMSTAANRPPSAVVIAPVVMTPPSDLETRALQLDFRRQQEEERLLSLRPAERQAAPVRDLEAEIARLKNQASELRAQAAQSVAPAPEWMRPDAVLRAYHERLQDLRTRYSEDHPWIQSVKNAIERMERAREGQKEGKYMTDGELKQRL
jgi:predicted RNase H-like nuclease (RuvC/YqgF family)